MQAGQSIFALHFRFKWKVKRRGRLWNIFLVFLQFIRKGESKWMDRQTDKLGTFKFWGRARHHQTAGRPSANLEEEGL